MKRTRVIAFRVATAFATLAGISHGQEPLPGKEKSIVAPPRPERRFRFGLGVAVGSRVGSSLAIDGEADTSDAGGAIAGAVIASIDARLEPWFSLGILGRINAWGGGYTTRIGALGRSVKEIAFVPKLRTELRQPGTSPFDGYIGFPVGMTWPTGGERPERAVRETEVFSPGANLGVLLGIDWAHGPLGAYFELGYIARVFSSRVTSTPVAEPEASLIEHLDYVDHVVGIGGGVLFAP